MTALFEQILFHMIQREIFKRTVEREINIGRWKEWEVILSIARLAFDGCKKNKFEFSLSVLKEFGVSEPWISCGFLLQKFDPSKMGVYFEFPHQTIQEFFAGLHCYNLVLSLDEKERNSVMEEIQKQNNKTGRFFFGICSKEGKFENMLEWLNPTIHDTR